MEVSARIAAASGDVQALLALAIELSNRVTLLEGVARADEERRAKQAERTRRARRNAASRDVPLQGVTERDSNAPSSPLSPPSLLPPTPPNNSSPALSPPPTATAPPLDKPARRVVQIVRPPTGPAYDAGPYIAAYSERFPGATPPGGQIAKALKPLEAEHGAAEVLRRWRLFLAAKGEFGVAYFARTYSEWATAPPLRINGGKPSPAEAMTASMQRLFTPTTP